MPLQFIIQAIQGIPLDGFHFGLELHKLGNTSKTKHYTNGCIEVLIIHSVYFLYVEGLEVFGLINL